jgi:hypothetical protein
VTNVVILKVFSTKKMEKNWHIWLKL